jgi:hypothetical protein
MSDPHKKGPRGDLQIQAHTHEPLIFFLSACRPPLISWTKKRRRDVY